VPWTESSSLHFEARHEDSDELGTIAVLELLEATRESLARTFPQVPEEVTVVMHATPQRLCLAAPALSGRLVLAAHPAPACAGRARATRLGRARLA
jgi:hypothetical protein